MFPSDLSVAQHRHMVGALPAFGLNDVRVALRGVADDANGVWVQGSSAESSSVWFFRAVVADS